MVTSRRKLGDRGEALAARFLLEQGLPVVATNIRTSSGEIDLIVQDGTDLVFVEVRTRRGLAGDAAESLSPTKLQRMWRCAMEYCESQGLDPETARVDAVVIDLGTGGPVVEHLRGLEVPELPER
jgi:putative endonuclease